MLSYNLLFITRKFNEKLIIAIEKKKLNITIKKANSLENDKKTFSQLYISNITIQMIYS